MAWLSRIRRGLLLPYRAGMAVLGHEREGTLDYYRFVRYNASLRPSAASEMPLEVIIPLAQKDQLMLPYVVQGVRANLRHPIRRMTVICPEDSRLRAAAEGQGCRFVPEGGLLPFRKEDIHYRVGSLDRGPWLFQQFLKLSADQITDEKHYLIIDADTVLLKPQVFEVEGRMLLLHADEHRQAYYDAYQRLVGHATLTPLVLCGAPDAFLLRASPRTARIPRRPAPRVGTRPSWTASTSARNPLSASTMTYEALACTQSHPKEIRREYWFNTPMTRDHLTKFRLCRRAEVAFRLRSTLT